MLYELIIEKRSNATLGYIKQTIWIQTNLSMDYVGRDLKLIKIVKEHENELTDPLIFDEQLYNEGKCSIIVIPFPTQPKWLSNNDIIIDTVNRAGINENTKETPINEETQEIKNAIMQIIHHKGYGVGSSFIAGILRELAEYYED